MYFLVNQIIMVYFVKETKVLFLCKGDSFSCVALLEKFLVFFIFVLFICYLSTFGRLLLDSVLAL